MTPATLRGRLPAAGDMGPACLYRPATPPASGAPAWALINGPSGQTLDRYPIRSPTTAVAVLFRPGSNRLRLLAGSMTLRRPLGAGQRGASSRQTQAWRDYPADGGRPDRGLHAFEEALPCRHRTPQRDGARLAGSALTSPTAPSTRSTSPAQHWAVALQTSQSSSRGTTNYVWLHVRVSPYRKETARRTSGAGLSTAAEPPTSGGGTTAALPADRAQLISGQPACTAPTG